jgi:hypothetical protein
MGTLGGFQAKKIDLPSGVSHSNQIFKSKIRGPREALEKVGIAYKSPL